MPSHSDIDPRVFSALDFVRDALGGGAASPTVEALWHRFAASDGPALKAWPSEKGRAKNHLLPFFGSMPALAVRPAIVKHYRAKRRGEKSCRGAPTTPANRNREVALLRRLFNWAVEEELLAWNPLVRVKMEKEPKARQHFWSDEELQKLCAASDELGHHYLAVAMMMCSDDGMRRDEIRKLRRAQVDWKDGSIWLAHDDTKSGEGRLVLLTERSWAALRSMPTALNSPYVFYNPINPAEPIPRSTWQDHFKDAVDLTGLNFDGQRPWFHDTRRGAVRKMDQANIPRPQAMAKTGHKTEAIYVRYSITNRKDQEGLREQMNRLLAGDRKAPQRAR